MRNVNYLLEYIEECKLQLVLIDSTDADYETKTMLKTYMRIELIRAQAEVCNLMAEVIYEVA